MKLLLHNGEQLLLTLFIPVTLLIGLTLLPFGWFGPDPAAVPSRGPGGGGDILGVRRAGDRRGFRPRYGALERLGATALPGGE